MSFTLPLVFVGQVTAFVVSRLKGFHNSEEYLIIITMPKLSSAPPTQNVKIRRSSTLEKKVNTLDEL